MIRYFKEDTSFSPKGKRLISKWLREVAAGRGYEIGELNYIFCSDPYLKAINQQFLGHDYETDIITFDNSDDYRLETGRRGVSAATSKSEKCSRTHAMVSSRKLSKSSASCGSGDTT